MDVITAVKSGDLQTVQQLVHSTHDIKVQEKEFSMNLLHLAAKRGYQDVFSYLTGIGLDPNNVDGHGQTVLHMACLEGQYEMVVFLMKLYPYMKDIADKQGHSILHNAAASGNVELFKHLVNQGLDINCVTNCGGTVLHRACKYTKCYNVVKYIVTTFPSLKGKVDVLRWTALHYAAMTGNGVVFQYLVDAGLDVYCETENDTNVLLVACAGSLTENSFEVVKYIATRYPALLKQSNKMNSSALHYAAVSGNVEVFQFLEEQGLDVFALGDDNCTVLHIACENGRHDLVKYLITKYPALASMETADKSTPLLLAAKKKHDQVIVCLMDKLPGLLEHTLSLKTDRKRFDQINYLKTFTIAKYLSLKAELEKSDIARKQTEGEQDFEGDIIGAENAIKADMIRFHVKESGRTSDETSGLLHWLCARAKSHLPGLQHVTTGYYIHHPNEPVLLGIAKEKLYTFKDTFATFTLIVRKEDHVSDEAKYIRQIESERNLNFSTGESIQLRKTLTKYSKHLMDKHSNLGVISASKLKSRNYGKNDAGIEEKTCIVLYVPVKGIIPFNEEPFPGELDEFPVDVREGLFEPYTHPCDFHEQLMMGCQIASAYAKGGALGGFLESQNGRIFCLTCWHVFITDGSKSDLNKDPWTHKHFNRDVFQPDISSHNYKFGEVIKYAQHAGDESSIGVDAALIEITDPRRRPTTGHFPDATAKITGFSQDYPMQFTSGKIVTKFEEVPRTCNVVKYGPKTGHTIGMLRLEGTAVRKQSFTYFTSPDPKDKYELHQQFEYFNLRVQKANRSLHSGTLALLYSSSLTRMMVIMTSVLSASWLEEQRTTQQSSRRYGLYLRSSIYRYGCSHSRPPFYLQQPQLFVIQYLSHR